MVIVPAVGLKFVIMSRFCFLIVHQERPVRCSGPARVSQFILPSTTVFFLSPSTLLCHRSAGLQLFLSAARSIDESEKLFRGDRWHWGGEGRLTS